MQSIVESILTVWWIRLPRLAQRYSTMLTACLLDGLYLAYWRYLGMLLPPVALCVGLWVGWSHPGYANQVTYTYSLAAMAFMLLWGGASATLGTWFFTGYIVTDFLFIKRPAAGNFITTNIPLILSYALLAQLVIFIPLASQSLRKATLPRIRLGDEIFPLVAPSVEALLQGLIQSFLVFVWVNATPTLIRPIFTWRGSSPMVGAIAPLQTSGHVLIVLGGLLGIGRVFLEDYLSKNHSSSDLHKQIQQMADAPEVPNRIPTFVNIVMQTLFMTLMASGLLKDWIQGFYLAILIFALLLLRQFVSTKIPVWYRLMSRIPILFRLIIIIGANYWFASVLLEQYWSTDDTFFPILLCTALGIVVFSVFLPQKPCIPANQEQSPSKISGTHQFLILFLGTALGVFYAEPSLAHNCGSLSDCYNVIRNAIIAGAATATVISLVLDLTPIVGDFKGIVEGIVGKDLITGDKLSPTQRLLGSIPVVGRGADIARHAARGAESAANSAKAASAASKTAKAAAAQGDIAKATEAANAATKHAEDAANASKMVGDAGSFAKADDTKKAADASSDAAKAAEEANDAARKSASGQSDLAQYGGLDATEGRRTFNQQRQKLDPPSHPLSKHGPDVPSSVKDGPNSLEQRVAGGVRRATKFSDRAKMESAINKTIKENQDNINRWLGKNPQSGVNKPFTGSPNLGNLGEGYQRNALGGPEKISRPLENTTVILKSNGQGGYVIQSAYPH